MNKEISINSNLQYIDIFILAAQYINSIKDSDSASDMSKLAYQCFYKNNKKAIKNPLKPSAIERAYIVNKFHKLSSSTKNTQYLNIINSPSTKPSYHVN